uniref:Uncharacterized protein n=1 Tax=Tanacetum cinerariifolium TaxID=118510 RepID=A0A699HH46_TANCI|nr:hypothetical protein [Tanacetum cinerariifolium]
MKHEKGTDEEEDSFDDQLVTLDEVEDSSAEEVESTDEEEDASDEDYELELIKKSNSKGSKAKSDRSKFKIISYKVNDKDESSQATPKAQSSQAKAPRPNVIVDLASQYKNLATNCVEKKFGTRIVAEGSKSKGKRGLERYFDVDLTAKKLVMHRLDQLLRNFRMKLRYKYILPNLNTPSKLNEIPVKYSTIAKLEEWVEFVNYTTTVAYKEKSARAKMAPSKNVYYHKIGRGGYVFVKEKMIENKEIEADEEPPPVTLTASRRLLILTFSIFFVQKKADDKIKEGTLNLDDGTVAIKAVFGKEKGGYARGVGGGVTYKRYFDLPRSRQATNE